jgi:hypothetical protein
MGISMFAAISWRRANRHGAFASLISSSLLFFYLTYQDFGVILRWEAENFGYSLLLGFVALAVVSWLTPPESKELLDPFYKRLSTHKQLDEETGKEIVIDEPGHDLLVAHLFDLELSKGLGRFYKRFRVDINGLLVASGVVVIIIILGRGILLLP